MKSLPFFLPVLLTWGLGCRTSRNSHDADKVINTQSVQQVEQVLSADDMQGRAVFTPGIEKAAVFIEGQFKDAGLQTWNQSDSYRQPFSMIRTKITDATADFDGNAIPKEDLYAASAAEQLDINENSGYEKAYIRAGQSLPTELRHYTQTKKNWLILVDTSFSRMFARMNRPGRQQFKSDANIVAVCTTQDPAHYHIHIQQEVKEMPLANIVGILPGKSKKNEYVIFSAHYDHLGIRKPDEKGDSIYNGANDDASGSTAVILLARYFSKLNNNERTLVFATFTAEEIGEYGSQYFSSQFDPASVVAMFNIEMIGTESKWGTNSAYITGYERTDMGNILEKNLAGSPFTFYPDPYPQQNLFYRSDNASLARQGVPAHTISTSKMDSEKYYHTPEDEISTLNMENMARIIQSIAISSRSIVAGKATPTRVDTSKVR